MKRFNNVPLLLGSILLIFLINSCQRFEPEGFLYITTGSTEELTENNYKLNGSVVELGEDVITQHGFCWSESRSPTTGDPSTRLGSRKDTGSFSSIISDLNPGAAYYYRVYVISADGTVYGAEKSFTTRVPGLPTVTTTAVSKLTDTYMESGGNVTDDGGAAVTDRGVCISTSPLPTNDGSCARIGSGTGLFVSQTAGLTPNTTYYIRAYATNSVGTAYGNEISFKTWTGTVTDYDGNIYPTIEIGLRTWMAKNLKTTHYADGTAIPLVEEVSQWGALDSIEKAYCWYNNDASNKDLYGGLYSWAAVMNGAGSNDSNPGNVQGVCPDGWHMPSDAEWKELEMFLGMSRDEADNTGARGTNEGGKLKESGTTHWNSPNTGATNESGFSALPGGLRFDNGSFFNLGNSTLFWTATENNGSSAWIHALANDIAGIYRVTDNKTYGMSVRCISGTISLTIPTVTTTAVSDITETTARSGGEVTDNGGVTVTERGVCWSTSQTPTVSDSRSLVGSGTGSFTSAITGLSLNTTYYVRAYATNSEGTAYGDEISFMTWSGSMTDYDDNIYQTVVIGDQTWMAENLKTTHYDDGTAISLVEDLSDWDALSISDRAYCWYDNSNANRDTYGGLYTWAAAMNGYSGSDTNPSGVQGVCPDGWHIPSDTEWKQLEKFLGMSQSEADNQGWRGTVEGGKLKEAGTTHWESPNTGATNESGFTALPAGFRNYTGGFTAIGNNAFFWTSTDVLTDASWSHHLRHDNSDIYRDYNLMKSGMSVRCAED